MEISNAGARPGRLERSSLSWIDRAAYKTYSAAYVRLLDTEEIARETWNIESASTKMFWRRVVIAVLDELVYASPEMREGARIAGFGNLDSLQFKPRFEAALLELAQAVRAEAIRNPTTAARLWTHGNKCELL
jgi:hypothetical protein